MSQLRQEERPGERVRSQYLCVAISDGAGNEVHMRLGTFRKVLAWFAKLGRDRARRMSDAERRTADQLWKRRRI